MRSKRVACSDKCSRECIGLYEFNMAAFVAEEEEGCKGEMRRELYCSALCQGQA